MPELAGLPVLREAAARRTAVAFDYRGKRRRVDPYGLLLRTGFWYVVGRDHEHDELRTYRVDRIAGSVDTLAAETFERPEGFDLRAAFPSDPKQLGADGDHDAVAVVRVDGPRAAGVERELGADRVVERLAGGAIEVEVPCANVAGVPLVGARSARPRRGGRPAGRARRRHLVAPRAGGPAMRRRTAEERLGRLLVMLPWLMERGEVPIAEVARHFQMSTAEVAADLELAAMCGLPPFVDELIDVFIDDDVVVVGIPRLFTRPLRLTAPEGFALVAAGRAAMQLPGADPDGPLGRGLAKLAAALGDDAVVVDLPLTPAVEEAVADVTAAVKEAERLRVEYWTPSRDEVTERTITPRRVFNDRGDWYVVADDGRSGERRTFRVDRFESIVRTGERDPAPDGQELGGGAPDWFADGGLPRVTLRLAPAATWVVERYPVDEVADAGAGLVEARFPVASQRWLERLLLRLGPDAEVLEPEEWRTLGGEVARRVLAALRGVEGDEVGLVGDAVGGEEVGEDGRRGHRVGEGVVGPLERDVVAGADVGEAVGELAIGVEAAGQLQRAQPAVERQLDPGPAGRLLDEGGVELGVVGGEHGAVEPAAELGERLRSPAARPGGCAA